MVAVVVAGLSISGCGRGHGQTPPAPTSQRVDAAGRASAPFSTANPTRSVPSTTDRASTTPAARPATSRAPRPVVPRLLFGIGPEANAARATPLARQAPVRMLTSWYNGPGDLDWMATWGGG